VIQTSVSLKYEPASEPQVGAVELDRSPFNVNIVTSAGSPLASRSLSSGSGLLGSIAGCPGEVWCGANAGKVHT